MTCDEIVSMDLLETPGPSSDILQVETVSSSSQMKSLEGDLITAAQQVGLPQEFINNIPQHIPTFRWSHNTRLDVLAETVLPCSLLLDECMGTCTPSING